MVVVVEVIKVVIKIFSDNKIKFFISSGKQYSYLNFTFYLQSFGSENKVSILQPLNCWLRSTHCEYQYCEP